MIGVAVGLLLVFGSGTFINFIGLNKMTANITATVLSVSQPTTEVHGSSSACTPQAKYTVVGKEYIQTSSISSSSACSLSQGQNIQINYNPDNPGAWAYDIGITKKIFSVFPYIGAVIAIICFVTFVIRLVSILFGFHLLRKGRRIAKTVPADSDFDSLMTDIRKEFTSKFLGQK